MPFIVDLSRNLPYLSSNWHSLDPTLKPNLLCLITQSRLASSPLEFAQRIDVVFTMVGQPSDVQQVVLGSDGLLSGLNPNFFIFDTTSSHPQLVSNVFEPALEKGCWAVDTPLSGIDIGVRDGNLTTVVGGDGGVVKWLTPGLGILERATYVGEAGCGHSCKVMNQERLKPHEEKVEEDRPKDCTFLVHFGTTHVVGTL
ncbi:hypothetical protein F2P56_030347 [Juglans regia]|uniref:6-phosphogluconate dehydrogenase NADP-binding domain-containing protein n=1 Tax=Juglans regia TaxID=51240 RepID=A0A833UD75_JUGRE|nr:hypothetical protein F2P56_030347 [Juglans regia]